MVQYDHMEKTSFTKKEFYDLVWATPLSRLSTTYDISDNGLRKICKKYVIPIPSNGYWQKLKHNKPVLKQKYRPDNNESELIQLSLRAEGSDATIDKSPLITLTNAIMADEKAPLEVPKTLYGAHSLIEQTKYYWERKKKDAYRREENIEILNVSAEPENKPRALRLMNGLIKLLQYRGHTIKVNQYETFAVINGVDINLSIREATKRVPPPQDKPYLTSDYIPTGELVLKAGKWSREKEWRDGKTKLEMLLARFVAWLELYAKEELESRERSRLWNIEYEKKKKSEEDEKLKRQQEAKRYEELLDESSRYMKAKQMREYIEAKKAKSIKNGTVSREIQLWIKWASEKADLLDPLTCG